MLLHGVICRIVCQHMSIHFVLQFEDFQPIRSGFTGDLRTCLTDSDVSVWRGRGQRELSVLGEAMCEYTSEACVSQILIFFQRGRQLGRVLKIGSPMRAVTQIRKLPASCECLVEKQH